MLADVRISDLTAAPASAIVDGSLLELSTGSGGQSFSFSLGALRTYYANTFAQVSPSNGAVPTMAGTAAVGSSVYAARADHTHPTDTSRAATGANGDITGLSALTSLSCKGLGQFWTLMGGGQNANLAGAPPALAGSGKWLAGWNLSNGRGETVLVVNRGGGAGGGFDVVDQDNSGINTTLISITASGGATFAKPAATLAGLGGATASDLGIAQQNVLFQGLLIAALRNVPTGLVDGIIDPFSSTADVNAGASSGYTFNSSAGTIGATVTPASTTAQSTTAAAISDSNYSASYPASNAFDGSTGTVWGSNQPGASLSGVAYVGQDFGAGNAKTVNQIVFTASSQQSNNVSSVLVQYADTASGGSGLGAWTTAATATLGTGAGAVTTINLPSGTGAHRAWRLLANANLASGSSWSVAEATMNNVVQGSTAAMVLQSATLASAVASPSAMRALLQVDSTSAPLAPNTDVAVSLSRDGGTTFTQGTLATIQAMPDGTAVLDTGWLSVAAQPAGNSTMTYRLSTPTQKAAVFTGVSMQVRP